MEFTATPQLHPCVRVTCLDELLQIIFDFRTHCHPSLPCSWHRHPKLFKNWRCVLIVKNQQNCYDSISSSRGAHLVSLLSPEAVKVLHLEDDAGILHGREGQPGQHHSAPVHVRKVQPFAHLAMGKYILITSSRSSPELLILFLLLFFHHHRNFTFCAQSTAKGHIRAKQKMHWYDISLIHYLWPVTPSVNGVTTPEPDPFPGGAGSQAKLNHLQTRFWRFLTN